MPYKKHLLHILLCLQIFTVSLHASYPLKFVFLLTNIGKKALKASALCIPTFMGLFKIAQEQMDYLETLIFVYPFDKEQQQKLLPLKNEIKDLALKTMPDAYSSCKTPKALVEYVESKKTEKLKKLFGEQFKFDEIALEQNMQKSKEAIKKLHNIDSDNTNNIEQVKAICDMLKKAGYDTDPFDIQVINNKCMPMPTDTYRGIFTAGTAFKYNDIYFIKINKKYTQSLGTLLHEINHILSGDLDLYCLKKYFTEKNPEVFDDFVSKLKNESLIIHKIKATKDFIKNFFEDIQCLSKYSQSQEYLADIKQIVTNTHLTKENKIEILTQYAELMEHFLTYEAAYQSEGQAATDRIFNNTMAQDYVHIPEERTLPLYDLTLLDGYTHPSWLSRYQLVMRAKQLIEEEQE